MGLDMYAYTLDARWLNDDQVTDVPVHKIARRAVGFIDLSDFELSKLTEDGLKQYWDKRRQADIRAQQDGWIDPDFAYWRKFNALHAWMERLYQDKGGTNPDFNCSTLRLTEQDLDDLTYAVNNKRLKPADGFFWGNPDEIYPEDLETISGFVERSKQALSQGKAVFYDSWW